MDRTIPAPIQTIVSRKDYSDFCDTMDTLAEKAKKKAIIYPLMILLGFVLGGVLIGAGGASGVWFLFVLGVPLCLASMIVGICFMIKLSNAMTNEINAACEDFSKVSPLFTVHYRTATIGHGDGSHSNQYFEFLICGSAPAAIASAPATASATPESVLPITNAVVVEVPLGSVDAEMTNDPTARLEKLEKLKGIITQEEYDAKRKEILDSV